MGLIKEGDDYVVLTDIAGVEDHLGDMDFKVAGTEDGHHRPADGHQDHGRDLRHPARRARAGQGGARRSSSARWPRSIDAPRERALASTRRASRTIQIDPDKIGLLIGKGGETIRGLQEEFEAQIDVNDEGQVLVYAADRRAQGDALVDRIRSMTKEVEVGDEFTGKVVKTTTFGAFVELAKGTDGLLHISNVSPGQRVDTVEEVLNKGDEIAVRVVEVDRERGRIGLRLAEDPEIAGKTAEELAGVGTGGGGGGRGDRGARRPRPRRPRPRRRRRRRPRRRPRLAAATATAARARDRDPRPRRTAASLTPSTASPSSTRACGSSRRRMPSVRSAALGLLRSAPARAARPTAEAGPLAPPRAPAVPRHRRATASAGDRPALRRHGRRAQRRHRQGDHLGLRADARPAPAERRST